mgnify:CR=1 FL=1
MKEEGNLRTYVLLLFSMLFWYKQAYVFFRPATVITLRLFISAALILISALVFQKITWPRLKDLKFFLLLSFFEPFLYFIGESYGMLFISSTLASVIIAIIPLITPFADLIFYKNKYSSANYAGIFVSFTGVVLVVYSDGKWGDAPWYGIALLLVAVLSTIGYTVLLKRLASSYNSLSIVWVQNLIGGIFFLPLFLFTEADGIRWEQLTLRSFLPVLYLAIFASSFAFLFFVQGIRKIGITKSVALTNFIPIVTAVFAATILKEKISFLKISGIIIVISGLFLTQYARLNFFKRKSR